MMRGDIERAFASGDSEARRRATQGIPQLAHREALDALVRALGDEDWRVRKEAAAAALAVSEPRRVVERLVDLLRPGDNVGLRNAVVETLASFGALAVPVVIDVLPELDADGRKLAVEVLGRSRDPSAMPALRRLLSDEDPNVRMAAAESIGELGSVALDPAAESLVSALESPDLHLRLASLDALNRLEVVVPWERIEPLTRDPILRRAALVAASRTGRAEAGVLLAEALSDEQGVVFSAALLGLAELVMGTGLPANELRERLAPLSTATRERLVSVLQPGERDANLRRAGLVVAASLGEPGAIDFAIDALVDDQIAIEATAALRIYGSQALPRLLSRVAHGDAPLRAAAIDLVTSLADSPHQKAVRLALRAAIADPAAEAASAALIALGSLGGPEDVAAVFAVLGAGAPGTAAAAEEALSQLSVRHPGEARAVARHAAAEESPALATVIVIGALGGGVLGALSDDVAFLATALSSADAGTRRGAVRALASVGSDLGVEAVEFALADEERDIRLAAISALGRLYAPDGSPAGASRLLALVTQSEDMELVAAAIRALGTTGGSEVTDALLPLLRGPSPLLSVAAVDTLGRRLDPRSLPGLVEAAAHPHVEVVKAALVALEAFRDPRVAAQLGAALNHDAWDVRRLAADCLGRVGGEAAADLLRARLAREEEPLVLEALDRALVEIESPTTLRRSATIAPPKAET